MGWLVSKYWQYFDLICECSSWYLDSSDSVEFNSIFLLILDEITHYPLDSCLYFVKETFTHSFTLSATYPRSTLAVLIWEEDILMWFTWILFCETWVWLFSRNNFFFEIVFWIKQWIRNTIVSCCGKWCAIAFSSSETIIENRAS